MKSDSMLKDKAYVTPARKGWRGYRRTVCTTSVLHAKDGKALLKSLMPEATRQEHAKFADMHVDAAIKNKKMWNRLVDSAMLKTFGRPFKIGDYKISGICREEFDERAKNLLRKYAQNGGEHHALAIFHWMAAGHTHQTSISFCRGKGL